MSWQFLSPVEEVADLLRLRAIAKCHRPLSPGRTVELERRIQHLMNDDGNGGREW
jgi:hypothetical protein